MNIIIGKSKKVAANKSVNTWLDHQTTKHIYDQRYDEIDWHREKKVTKQSDKKGDS